ncbi:copper resistance CopC/CopD family protein [Azospirillum sp. sgz302134]
MRRRIVGWVMALLVLTMAPAAWAHAALVESVPADGARLDRPPPELTLRFNEPVSPVSVRVLGPDGTEVALPAPPKAEGERLRVALPGGLPAGTHVVSYRVTSEDGHPVAGSVLFGIGAEPDRSAAHAEEARQSTLLAATLVRALHYGSLLGVAGGGLFLLLVLGPWSPVNRRLKPGLCLGIGGAALLVVANVALTGAVLEGAPLTAVFGESAWKTAVASSAGGSAVLALLSLIAVALALVLEERGRGGVLLLLLGAGLASMALAATGHAATAEPRWLSTPLVLLHTLTVAFWIGAFCPLVVVLRIESPAEAARIVRRFSGLAMLAVGLLLLSGAGLSVLQLGEPRAILDTAYGQVWLGKMVCALVLLALAAFNRLRLTPMLEDAGAMGAARLRGSLFTEMVTAGLALLLTAALGVTPPPRARVEAGVAAPAGFAAAVTAKGRTAIITLTPARPGPNRVEARIAQQDGTPLNAMGASVSLALLSAGIEPIARDLTPVEPGVYAVDGVELPVAGAWSVRLDVLVSDFEKAPFRTEIPVRR